MLQDHFRRALEDFDVALVRKLWVNIMPHMPQPKNDEDAVVAMHMARTGTHSISFKARAYSHSWLVERAFPSQLPDHLKPKAQQICPVIVPTAALAVYTRTPVALAIRQAMEGAVLDEGLKDPNKTRKAILAARAKTRSKLLGIKE